MYLGYTMDITVISSVDDNILEKKNFSWTLHNYPITITSKQMCPLQKIILHMDHLSGACMTAKTNRSTEQTVMHINSANCNMETG